MTEAWREGEGTVPVWHAHNDRVNASFTRLINDHLKGRDENFTALQTKSLF